MENNGGCEQNCSNLIGSFECLCFEGYTLDSNGVNCSGQFPWLCVQVPVYSPSFPLDVDECLSRPCHPNATCVNTEGSFTCVCANNFEGDGMNCTRQCLNGFSLPTQEATECGW